MTHESESSELFTVLQVLSAVELVVFESATNLIE